ncbi:MAG: FAD-dependent oxidoreductase [Desulfobacterales bacterium]|nr:FAD-dependent oxidoreductase [Desulfobacterales bacterium]
MGVVMKAPVNTAEKAKDQVHMAAARVAHNESLDRLSVRVAQKALVIGGGASGMTPALELAARGYETTLVEKSDALGGNAGAVARTWRDEPVHPMLERLIRDVESNDRVQVLINATVTSCSGSVGNFSSDVSVGGETVGIQYGVGVGASSYKSSIPKTRCQPKRANWMAIRMEAMIQNTAFISTRGRAPKRSKRPSPLFPLSKDPRSESSGENRKEIYRKISTNAFIIRSPELLFGFSRLV